MRNNRMILKILPFAMSFCMCVLLISNTAKTATNAVWHASQVRDPEASADESQVADITIQNSFAGATVICNSASHSYVRAYTGSVNISCLSHAMPEATITDTGSVQCTPDVGLPLDDIEVRYLINVSTPAERDTYSCSGIIRD